MRGVSERGMRERKSERERQRETERERERERERGGGYFMPTSLADIQNTSSLSY